MYTKGPALIRVLLRAEGIQVDPCVVVYFQKSMLS
jgi:hypothetical protein